MLEKLAQKQIQNVAIKSVTSNPIQHLENQTLNRLTREFKDFIQFFDNNIIDKAIEKEFGRNYPTLSLSIKEKLFNKVN